MHQRHEHRHRSRFAPRMVSTGVITLTLVATVAALSAATPSTMIANTPLSAARFIIELNATDGDVGVQAFLDGEPWRRVKVIDPDGRKILEIKGTGILRQQGLTELFTESSEPSFEEFALEDFLDRFPEGEYRFRAKSLEGGLLVGTATFTHDIPDGPVILTPEEDSVVALDEVVVSWEGDVGPPGIDIVGFQVVVEREDPLRVMSVTLPATATSVTVPTEFLDAGTEYNVEVLAIEVSGNQTISELSFETAE